MSKYVLKEKTFKEKKNIYNLDDMIQFIIVPRFQLKKRNQYDKLRIFLEKLQHRSKKYIIYGFFIFLLKYDIFHFIHKI